MPTVEERLAALEAKMAQLTDTRPTTYYTHQYSGEEIDAAVGRALTGGALDTSVTNVSNQLGTFVRPNLLDNWYFGRPVDQRWGYIVPKGVNYYKVDGFVPQGPIPETVRVDLIDHAGSAIFNYGDVLCYVPKDGGYVRGYVPAWNGYSIDRWNVESDSGVVITFVDGGIHVRNTSSSRCQFKQILPNELNLAGRMITISVLVGDMTGTVNYALTQTDNPYKNSAICTITTSGLFSASGSVLTGQQKMAFVLEPGAEITILAVKLELGPAQTLAHQENGNWVLNEVPEYGEQLRRCQRYFQVHKAPYWFAKNDDGTYRLTLPIPPMRTVPAVTYDTFGTGTIIADTKNYAENSVQFYATGVTNYCAVLNLKLSADL